MSLQAAIRTYHDLLTPEIATETQMQLDNQLHRRGLFFGNRPLCAVLRPRFLTPEQHDYLQQRVRLLLRAFYRAYQVGMEDAEFRAQLGLTDWEEELVQVDPGIRDPSPTSRLDAFYLTESNELYFTEYNAETPAAAGYTDVLAEVFYALPVMRQFLRRYEVRLMPARHGVLHALLDAHHQWAGRHEAPRIAILDWSEVPTYGEFVIFTEYFKSHGLECVIADPRELEYRNGLLLAGDFPITLIYKRVLLHELVERCGMESPVIRAVRDRAVCMVNTFRCKLLHKKASLAVLSDERNERIFTPEEREAIRTHIPWTRRVEERTTTHGGKEVDLVPYIAENRQQLVLKANDEYGGKGIHLGWNSSQEEWEQALRTALSEPYIVQERVSVASEPYPSMVHGHVQMIDRMLDTAPFVYYGEYMDGCLTRLSTEALLNVTAGGGSTVPTFIVQKR